VKKLGVVLPPKENNGTVTQRPDKTYRPVLKGFAHSRYLRRIIWSERRVPKILDGFSCWNSLTHGQQVCLIHEVKKLRWADRTLVIEQLPSFLPAPTLITVKNMMRGGW
jgi:hypothetical protein